MVSKSFSYHYQFLISISRTFKSYNHIFSGLKNWKEETPIVHIAPDIMEEYLDDCLEGEELATADKFKITFKYHFLGPPRMKTDGNEPLLKDQSGGTEVRKELPETEPLW